VDGLSFAKSSGSIFWPLSDMDDLLSMEQKIKLIKTSENKLYALLITRKN
jgi:hypothetical protein